MDFEKFTTREKDVLVAAFFSHKEVWNLDWDNLATNAGFKNAASARACLAPLKAKIKTLSEGIAMSDSPTKAKPAGKVKAEEASPTKARTPKKSAPNKKRKFKDENEDEGEGDAGAGAQDD